MSYQVHGGTINLVGLAPKTAAERNQLRKIRDESGVILNDLSKQLTQIRLSGGDYFPILSKLNSLSAQAASAIAVVGNSPFESEQLQTPLFLSPQPSVLSVPVIPQPTPIQTIRLDAITLPSSDSNPTSLWPLALLGAVLLLL